MSKTPIKKTPCSVYRSLSSVNILQSLAKSTSQSPVPVESKKQEYDRTLSNLKRGGLVFELAYAFIYYKRAKQSAAVFLMSESLRKGT